MLCLAGCIECAGDFQRCLWDLGIYAGEMVINLNPNSEWFFNGGKARVSSSVDDPAYLRPCFRIERPPGFHYICVSMSQIAGDIRRPKSVFGPVNIPQSEGRGKSIHDTLAVCVSGMVFAVCFGRIGHLV